MSNFCAYKAVGYIYPRDKDGNPISSGKVKGKTFRGNVLHDEGMYGAIMRQNPELLRCDRVDFETWGI